MITLEWRIVQIEHPRIVCANFLDGMYVQMYNSGLYLSPMEHFVQGWMVEQAESTDIYDKWEIVRR